ncbi:MAG: hypothetical protein JZU58_16790 [Curvibacter lanceolatus]|jgi:hypothetical protein|uniref:hypothetical protein n=1 Tax=Curvibacter lanceolatus TaxID=86182 RepID=UPI00037BC21D|nr:hypothetical protein [Curvibacter lanceolatus]MBV5293999.1 hypothetical protein [Curvibacter lanceolatus]
MLRPSSPLKNALLLAALSGGLQALAADAPAPAQATAATPQVSTAPQAAPCPQPDELQAADLYGLWRAEFEPQATPATVLLERHPDLAGSVRGVLQREGVRAWVSGDVDNGDFTLEESANGRNISATWLGEVSPESCGREIKGTWTSETQPQKPLRFVLRKVAQ